MHGVRKGIGIMIQLKAVSKSFDSTLVLDQIDWFVKKGSVFGLVGPNGAGKSTIIRSILGIIYPDSGEINFGFNGEADIPRSRLGYLPEERGFYKNVKVKQILLYLSGLKKYPKENGHYPIISSENFSELS